MVLVLLLFTLELSLFLSVLIAALIHIILFQSRFLVRGCLLEAEAETALASGRVVHFDGGLFIAALLSLVRIVIIVLLLVGGN